MLSFSFVGLIAGSAVWSYYAVVVTAAAGPAGFRLHRPVVAFLPPTLPPGPSVATLFFAYSVFRPDKWFWPPNCSRPERRRPRRLNAGNSPSRPHSGNHQLYQFTETLGTFPSPGLRPPSPHAMGRGQGEGFPLIPTEFHCEVVLPVTSHHSTNSGRAGLPARPVILRHSRAGPPARTAGARYWVRRR